MPTRRNILTILDWLMPVPWLGCAVASTWLAFLMISRKPTPGTVAVGLGCIALAIWSVRMALNARREARAASAIPPPPFLRGPPPPVEPPPEKRYSLAEPLRAELLRMIGLLEAAGMLEPGEVSRDEIIACAERDDFAEMDMVTVLGILDISRGERVSPLRHLAFFQDQVETIEGDALDMVREMVRISGRGASLHGLRCVKTGAIAPRGQFPPPNAVVEFQLDGQACALPFVLYSKNIPGGLMEGLARVLTRPDDGRRFFEAGSENLVICGYLAPEHVDALQGQLEEQPTWTQVRFGDERST